MQHLTAVPMGFVRRLQKLIICFLGIHHQTAKHMHGKGEARHMLLWRVASTFMTLALYICRHHFCAIGLLTYRLCLDRRGC